MTTRSAAHAVLVAAPPLDRWRRNWSEAITAFIGELRERGYSSYTVRDYRADIMHLATVTRIAPWEVEEGALAKAVAALDGEALSMTARRRRLAAYRSFLRFVLSSAQAPPVGPQLLDAAREAPWTDRVLVALVWFAGLRLSEIAHLEGRDLRIRKRQITTRIGSRIVPLHPALASLLAEQRHHVPVAPDRPIVPGLHGFAPNARTLHCRFHRLVQESGHPHVRPESLRREVSALLVRRGAPVILVKAFLGREIGRSLAPRHGRFVDLTCLADRIAQLPDAAAASLAS